MSVLEGVFVGFMLGIIFACVALLLCIIFSVLRDNGWKL